MVHVLRHGKQPLKEVGLPSDQEDKGPGDFNDEDAEALMELRLMQSAHLAASTGRLPQPLNEETLQLRLQKVKNAVTEEDQMIKRRGGKKKVVISLAAKQVLESKLRLAIIDMHSVEDTDLEQKKGKKIQLTNRMLLPFYKVDEVRAFMDAFSAVDGDFSGDLDVNEWIKLFTSLDSSISSHQARMIFMQVRVAFQLFAWLWG